MHDHDVRHMVYSNLLRKLYFFMKSQGVRRKGDSFYINTENSGHVLGNFAEQHGIAIYKGKRTPHVVTKLQIAMSLHEFEIFIRMNEL